MKKCIFSLVTLCGLFLFIGCGSGGPPAGYPALHPCQITVMLDGSPLEGASVAFKPESDGGMSASGKTDAQGVAEMYVQATHKGVPSGDYKVLITKQTRERNPAVKDEDVNVSPGESLPMDVMQKMYIVTDFVHPKFGNSSQTSLKISISEGENKQTFEVNKP